jgi:hypothetical protein
VGESIDTTQKNAEALLDTSKEVGLEVHPEKTKYLHVNATLQEVTGTLQEGRTNA